MEVAFGVACAALLIGMATAIGGRLDRVTVARGRIARSAPDVDDYGEI